MFGNSQVETERFNIYSTLLQKWQQTINLISNNSVAGLKKRHIEDSYQTLGFAPAAIHWADLGSGAGFPGLVTAIRLIGVPGALVHLIESDRRKCAFLREVSRETGAPTHIHNGRIEDVLPSIDNIEAISARALAPLAQLISMSEGKLLKGAVGVFLKGQDLGDELTQASMDSRFDIKLHVSRVNAASHIAVVTLSAASKTCCDET